jgi:hypothetical protein
MHFMNKKNMLWAGLALAAGIATTLFLMRRMQAKNGEQPPKKAPQVPLHNPGEQSEFTTAPISESEYR